MQLKNSCSKLETQEPWQSYNYLPTNSEGGQQAGGSEGKPFSLQQLQHTIQELYVTWDSFTLRKFKLKFTNGKSKEVGSTNQRVKGRHGLFQASFSFQPGELLDGELYIGEGQSFMSIVSQFKQYAKLDKCNLLGVSQIKFKTNFGRTFEAGLQDKTTNLKSYQVKDNILAGLMGSAENYINRLAFILYKPVKRQQINKIFWPALETINEMITEGESLNKEEVILNKPILHRGLKFKTIESVEKCNQSTHTYDFNIRISIDYGKDFEVNFNIPQIDDQLSLVWFFSTFSKQQQKSFESFNEEINLINLNKLQINNVYDSIQSTSSFKYDHFTSIKQCSCVKYKQHSVEGLNKGLMFDIHYMLEFEDGTEIETFQEGTYKAKQIVIPDREKIEQPIIGCNS